jgi:hypothetical protein
MPLDPMTGTCPTCGTRMVPKLIRKQEEREDGPFLADVPVILMCPVCSAPELDPD